MFELSIAYKYLMPRWRQLSVSIISFVSTLVIALVVWLIVVFFSVKDGLENNWIDKITAITAPVRMIPTDEYYHSYYFLADSISAASDYTTKTIAEKLASTTTDPYDPLVDEEAPKEWGAPDRDSQGNLKDLVKMAFLTASSLDGNEQLKATDFETTAANLRLRLLRSAQDSGKQSQQFLEHPSLVGSFDADHASMAKTLIQPTAADFNNLLHMQAISLDNIQEETPHAIHKIENEKLRSQLHQFFKTIKITSLKTPSHGWQLPKKLLLNTELQAVAIFKNHTIVKMIVPELTNELPSLIKDLNSKGLDAHQVRLKIDAEGNAKLNTIEKEFQSIASSITVHLAENIELPTQLIENSIENVKTINHLVFNISGEIQGYPLSGNVALDQLEIAKAHIKSPSSNAFIATADADRLYMPAIPSIEPLLLPKAFKDSGALIGDQGYLSYYSPTPSTIQEQRIPVVIAGFYDPGIIPIGGKYILASRKLTALIRASYNQEDSHFSNGINVRFNTIANAPKVKADLQKAFESAGISPYWEIETFQEYEFSKDIIQQLKSEKNLFSLISLIIIIVACSNIISMLIILVNDKKLEIGILRSMGATSTSIAMIFGICGAVMGTIGSLVGILAAVLTLRYVNELVGLMSRLQGHDLFNPIFYGTSLPTELSLEALMFVIMTTVAISLLAGIVPAFKASMMRPSVILRAE